MIPGAAALHYDRHMPVHALPIRLTAPLLLLCGLCLAAPPAWSGAGEKTLVVDQQSEYFGNIKVYINSKALRVNLSNTAYIVARAPDWKVGMYNSDTHVCYEQSLQDWLKCAFSQDIWFSDMRIYDWPLKKKATGATAGLQSVTYGLPRRLKDGTGAPLSQGIFGEYVVSFGDGIKLPEQACYILERTVRAPKIAAVPLAMHVPRGQSKFSKSFFVLDYGENRLKSNKSHTETLSDDFFKSPTGYRPVHREADVVIDRAARSETDNWVKEFGWEERYNPHPHRK